jgi:lipoprotein-anchoring transpeptidase ErfK/SrfK
MEVLLTRQTRRLSRLLIAILLLSFSAAALSFIYRMNHAAPAAPAPDAAQASVPAPSDAQPTTEPSPPTIDPTTQAEPAAELIPGPTTEPSASISSLVADAQAKIDAGGLLEARDQLNSSLQSGQLDESQAASVKALMSQINQTVVFGRQRFADDPYGGVYVVQSGDNLARIALEHDCTWELIGRINGIDPKHLRAGATIKVIQGPFFAVVDKRKFTMDIYLGGLPGEKSSMYVTTFKVGLGRDDSTPTGNWMVEPHRKLKHPTYYSPRGEGVIAADDPKNPLGGYWIGLSGTEGDAVGKLSYGIHGTNDPSSIGKQSSLGCIRMGADDIAVVFDLMVEGKSMVQVRE